MKRIRYTENEDGTVLTSPKFLAGKLWVVAYLNLKTNSFSIQNTETLRNIGASVSFKNKADGMKKVKTVLKTLGVVFTDEVRTHDKTETVVTITAESTTATL